MLVEPGSFSKITAVIDGSHVPREAGVWYRQRGTSDSGNSGHGKAGRASCPRSPPPGLPPDNLLSCVSLQISVCRHSMGSGLTQLLHRVGSICKVVQFKHIRMGERCKNPQVLVSLHWAGGFTATTQKQLVPFTLR